MDPKIEAPTKEDAARIEKQRSWVRDHYDEDARETYDTLKGKLQLLTTILDSDWVERGEAVDVGELLKDFSRTVTRLREDADGV